MTVSMFATTIDKTVAKAHAYMQLIDLVYLSDLVPLNYRGAKVNGQWRDYPEAKTKANLLAAALLGDGMGVDPFTAWSNIYPTQAGKLGLAADFKLSLCQAAGHDVEVLVRTPKECTTRGRRKGSDTWVEVTITAADANAAGWVRRNPVYGTPQGMSDMLYHRASGRVCDMVGADVLHGLVTIDDVEDLPALESEYGREVTQAEAMKALALQPGDRIRSSVVGRLIEQQHTPTPEIEHVAPQVPPDSALAELVEHTRQQRETQQALLGAKDKIGVSSEQAIADDREEGETDLERAKRVLAEADIAAEQLSSIAEDNPVEEDPGIDRVTWNKINAEFRRHGISSPNQADQDNARLTAIQTVTQRRPARGSEMTTWEGEAMLNFLTRSDTAAVHQAAGWVIATEETDDDQQ